MRRSVIRSLLLLAVVCLAGDQMAKEIAAASQGAGELRALDGRGACPLERTGMRAEVSGPLARVTVTQEFRNPFNEPIEAVYIFPLPQAAAVDDLLMRVGARSIRGQIRRREEAQAIYEEARRSGRVAALLDQERPNIFTQQVANIAPGERVTITISYVEMIKYEAGTYELNFPTVVGPRYMPKDGAATDAERIAPPVARKRAGHDLTLEVAISAGVPITSIASPTHEIEVTRDGEQGARVCLKGGAMIPNRDFVLRYGVAGQKINDALLAHADERGGFFAFILQPPDRVAPADIRPKELVFVLDTSGSMHGFPIEKAKETMKLALEGLHPQDTFNLITFSGDTHVLFPSPVPATEENLRQAQEFLAAREGRGGTEMMKAIRAALAPSGSPSHMRIVCFMTDGYVGNDFEIIAEVQKHPEARIFSFGIGNAVNRFLLDKLAEEGRGEVEYVSLQMDGSAAARRFHERIRSPLLTDLEIDWGGLEVRDLLPARLPDLFSARPVVVSGRYFRGGRGTIRLRGRIGIEVYEREIPVALPDSNSSHEVIATLWARARIDELMSQDYRGLQNGAPIQEVREAIVDLGLTFRLLTQYTSFVAVEEMIINDGGTPRRIEVPVELPSGVSPERIFNDRQTGGQIGGPLIGRPAMPQNMSVTETVTIESRERGAFKSTRPGGIVPGPRIQRPPSSPADRARAKLDARILEVIRRVARNERVETAFVRAGQAEVQVFLTEKTDAVRARLRELGFEMIADPSSKLVIGRIKVEALERLAALDFVRHIAPLVTGAR